MKATIDVPDDLYRKVKAKTALQGRAVREITIELYQRWLEQEEAQAPPVVSAYEMMKEFCGKFHSGGSRSRIGATAACQISRSAHVAG